MAQEGAHGTADLGGSRFLVLRPGIGVRPGGAGLLKGEEGIEGAGGEILLGLGKLLVVVSDPQLLQVVAAVGGGEKIGGHLGVKEDALGGDPLVHQLLLQLFGSVDHLLDAGGKEGLEHMVVVLQPVGKEQGGVAFGGAGLKADADCVQAGQGQHGHMAGLPPQGQQLLGPGGILHHLAGAGALCHFALLGRALPLGGGEVVFVNELGKFQLQEQLIEAVVVHLFAQVLLGVEVQRGVTPDGGQIVGHAGHLLPLLELFNDARLGGGAGGHLRGGHGLVQLVNGAVPAHQGHGGLLAHALDAGDVVAGVTHEGLEVDDVDGVKAVFLPEGVGRHILGGGAAHAGGHQLHRGVVGDQLEGVLVAGDHDGVPPGGGVLGGDGAHQVVRLPAVHLVDGDVHGGQHILQNGHLAGQLVGHPLPGGLVAVIGQMAEGGSLAVKGDAQGVGVAVVQQLAQDI